MTVERIDELVCSMYNIEVKLLRTKSRRRIFCEPRQICMFLQRRVFGFGVVKIGNRYNRNHSTVSTSIQTVQDLMQTNREYKNDITKLLNQITT